ncbi:PAAR domain-containing protein [Iodobacter sp. CM08]|uniref:PAAR domain-containing protein n=1 Tax=Iodobacter sp. CM08 TaxID=3085902 RepID=UPI002981C1C2|nr:PAAR domain-containing protein [Iodobacter sp. CM08]MDW5416458.1 PAAR domain-containing protein [Iodobacter sp. CM08]
MAKRAIIRIGDLTSHGGVVLEGFSTLNIYGKNAAGVGHKGQCPQCKTTFTIVAGASNYTFMGKNVAVEGMLTSCGATLIATQGQATVDDASGAASSASPPPKSQIAKALAANTPVATSDSSKWIKFTLDEIGSCEGLQCTAHFDDGSKMGGIFDSTNLLAFNNPTGQTASRLEFAPVGANTGNSVAQALLKHITG